jgi:hypothetical protein
MRRLMSAHFILWQSGCVRMIKAPVLSREGIAAARPAGIARDACQRQVQSLHGTFMVNCKGTRAVSGV